MSYKNEYASIFNIEKIIEDTAIIDQLSRQSIRADLLESEYELVNQKEVQQATHSFERISVIDWGFIRVPITKGSFMGVLRISINTFKIEDYKKIQEKKYPIAYDFESILDQKVYNFTLPFGDIRYKGNTPDLEEILSDFIIDNELESFLKVLYPRENNPVKVFTQQVRYNAGYNLKSRGDDLNKLLGLILTTLEHIIFLNHFHIQRIQNPDFIASWCFIKDGPLWFTQSLLATAFKEYFHNCPHPYYYIGLEKSWKLTDFMEAYKESFNNNSYIVVNEEFVSTELDYGESAGSYFNNTYSEKILLRQDDTYSVVNIVTQNSNIALKASHIAPLLKEFKTSLYENALIPLVITNESSSLSSKGIDFIREQIVEKIQKDSK